MELAQRRSTRPDLQRRSRTLCKKFRMEGATMNLKRLRSPDLTPATDPRETWRVLPVWIQPLLTWLSGKPLLEERAWPVGPWHHFAAAVVPVIAGITATVSMLNQWQ